MFLYQYEYSLPIRQMNERNRLCRNQTNPRGQKASLNSEDIHNIDQLIQKQSDNTIHEIIDRL